MTDPTDLTRRAVLTVGSFGAFGGALVLAGCAADVSGDGGSSSSPARRSTDESPAEPSGAPDAPAAGGDIAALADVPVGGSIDATIDGEGGTHLAADRGAGQGIQRRLHPPGLHGRRGRRRVPLPVPPFDVRRQRPAT